MSADRRIRSLNDEKDWRVLSAVRFGRDRLVLSGTFPGAERANDFLVTTATGGFAATGSVWSSGDLDTIVLAHDGAKISADCSLEPVGSNRVCQLSMCTDDVAAFIRSGVAALDPTARADLLAFLVDAVAAGRDELEPALAHHLHLVRQALRPKLPPAAIDRDAAPGMKVEVVATISADEFYVRGWIGYPTTALASVTAVSPEGARAALLPSRLSRYLREDVADFYGDGEDRIGYGFACKFSLSVPNSRRDGWLVEVVLHDDLSMEAAAGETVHGFEAVRNLLVGDLALDKDERAELRRSHVSPAIMQVLELAQQRVAIRRVEQYGTPPDDPQVTIVVPLYRQVDFVEHQMIQFVHDPEISGADVVYVLDSPELGDYLIAAAHRIFRMYGVPFRVAVLSHNGGFSTANNLGATLARGRLLLLMNSDVLPDRPGWLSRLVTFHDQTPGVGAVGPKLVYEDESIQHAGMYFDRPVGATEWGNEHYFKGVHRSFAPACVVRRVPAVSAACMLIDTELYREFGGLRGIYVQGDFEDSDLCLRLSAAGYEHWYAAHVELYHLEGQSYPTWQRVVNGNYNRWLHAELWGESIGRVMAADARSNLVAN